MAWDSSKRFDVGSSKDDCSDNSNGAGYVDGDSGNGDSGNNNCAKCIILSAGGVESIILSAGCAESMILSVHAENIVHSVSSLKCSNIHRN